MGGKYNGVTPWSKTMGGKYYWDEVIVYRLYLTSSARLTQYIVILIDLKVVRTKWWRDNPYLWIVPADIDRSKFYLQIVPENKIQRRKEEKRTCSCPVGTATKGIACWYYHVWLLLSSSPLYVHWNHPCTATSSEILLGQSMISPDISWPLLPPSIISLVCWNHLWTSCYFRDYLLLLG